MAKRLRSLVDDRGDKKATIEFALDRKTAGGCDARGFQVLAGSDEVINAVLLVEKAPCSVPLLALLAPATDVGHCERTALLHPGQLRRRIYRHVTDAEVSIGGQQGCSRCGDVLAAHDEHGHLGAVLRRVEASLDRATIEVDGGARLGPDRHAARAEVESVDRRAVAREIEEGFVVGGRPRNPPALPMPWSATTPSAVASRR